MRFNSNKGEKEKIFKDKDFIYIAHIAMFLSFLLLLVVLSVLTSAVLIVSADSKSHPSTALIGVGIVVAIYTIPLFFLMRWHYRYTKGMIRPSFRRQFAWFLAGVIIYSLMTLLVGYFVYGNTGPNVVSIPDGRFGSFVPVYVIGMVILLPLFEEYLMRGVLIERFFSTPSELTIYYESILFKFGIQEQHIRIAILYVIQIVVFTILHADGSNASVLLNALFGALLTTVYLKTRVIWVPVALHASVNVIGLMMILGN